MKLQCESELDNGCREKVHIKRWKQSVFRSTVHINISYDTRAVQQVALSMTNTAVKTRRQTDMWFSRYGRPKIREKKVGRGRIRTQVNVGFDPRSRCFIGFSHGHVVHYSHVAYHDVRKYMTHRMRLKGQQ
jgi:hypothetical protein